MSDVDLIKEAETEARRAFRFYSRKVFLAPANRHFHEQRINAALLLSEKEPLQGAVADFFYGCWYDIPYDVNNLFTRIKDRLYPHVAQGFRDCIDKKRYIQRNSMLATRWSVLISPSLNEQKQRLRISSDDAKEISCSNECPAKMEWPCSILTFTSSSRPNSFKNPYTVATSKSY